MTMPPLSRLRAWAPALAVVLILAWLYPGAMFRGHVFQSADAESSDAFRLAGDAAGGYPQWTPFIFIGMPTFGSLAYTPGLYPPGLILEFLQRQLHFPPLTWLLAHLVFGGLGMVWLLGRWRLPLAARVVGAVGWLMFARIVAWSVYGHGSKLGAAMYLPWLVGLTFDVLTRGRLRSVGWLALLLGLQFLRGHVQITYYTLLLLGFIVVWHVAWPLGDVVPIGARLRRAGLVAVALALAFLVGAVMLLPVHDYAAISTRGGSGAGGGVGFDYATAWSLGPQEIPTLVQPGAMGFGKATYMGPMPFTDYPNYLGWLWLVLAGAAWWTRRRSLVLCCAVAGVLALLVALGGRSPGLYQAMYAALPYFDKFRVPSMILVLLAFVAAVLAGQGAAALAEDAPGRDRQRRIVLIVLAALGALTLVAGASGATAGAFRSHLRDVAAGTGKQAVDVLLDGAWALQKSFLVRDGLVLLAAAGAIFLATRHAVFRARALVWVLALLLCVDLGSVARLVTAPQTALQQVVADSQGRGRLLAAARLEHPYRRQRAPLVDPALAAALQAGVGHERVYPLARDSQSNAYMTVGVRSLGGYYPAKPAVAEELRQRLFGQMPSGHLANWLGATTVTFARALPAEAFDVLRQVGLDLEPTPQTVGNMWLYHNRAALPRARLVDRFTIAANDSLGPFLDAIVAGRHDASAAVVLDQVPEPPPVPAEAPLPRPTFVKDGPDEIVLATEAPSPAVLVLADLAAPGWIVHVDGAAQPLLTADHALRAVALPAGKHEVRFAYHTPGLRAGFVASLIGLLGIVVLLVVGWRRHE